MGNVYDFPIEMQWVGCPGQDCSTEVSLEEESSGRSATLTINYGGSCYDIGMCGLDDLMELGKWLTKTAAEMKRNRSIEVKQGRVDAPKEDPIQSLARDFGLNAFERNRLAKAMVEGNLEVGDDVPLNSALLRAWEAWNAENGADLPEVDKVLTPTNEPVKNLLKKLGNRSRRPT